MGTFQKVESLIAELQQEVSNLKKNLGYDEAPEDPLPAPEPAIISNVRATYMDGRGTVFLVKWDVNDPVAEYMDVLVQFYRPNKPKEDPWQHSGADGNYQQMIPATRRQATIGLNEPADVVRVRVVSGEWVDKKKNLFSVDKEFGEATVKKKVAEELEPDPIPTPEPTPHIPPRLVKIHGEEGDPLGGINGVILDGGSVKVYVGQRNGNNLLEFESVDMENWTNNGPSMFFHGTNLFKGSNGRLHGYQANDSDMNLYLGSELQNNLGTAYRWRIDGAVNMHETPDGRFRSFGRVRGNSRPKNKGGWGGDVPPFPADEFDDRRGISYHSNDTWESDWKKNKILADPADYFEGYHNKHVDLVPDFYESIFFPSGYGFVTVFWKRKSRKWVSDDGRKKRLTGEVYPVPALYKDLKITLYPDRTVIPRKYHEHDGIPLVDGKLSIGEIYIGGLMQKGETIYIFYKHRGGIHYESHGKFDSGIYVYQMHVTEFNNLYK